ncbi:MAG: hypothetical protein IKK57_06290 [Clostridia bacterium]|nr:hypothetical protein [Clostridia bacterium]
MKKLLSLLLTLMLLLPGLSLAESAPAYFRKPAGNGPAMSPELYALQTAHAVLMERYSLTIEALGLFDTHVDVCGETAVVTYRGNAVPEALTGAYIVIIAPHGVQPMWTHDGSLVPWQSGDLASSVWGMPQLEKYLRTSSYERYDAFTPYFPDDLDSLDDFLAAGGSYHEVSSANRDAANSARALAKAAVTAMFSLTEEEAAQLVSYADDARLVRYPDNHGEWEVMLHWENGSPAEVSFWVVIHAETGEVLNLVVSSGGVG